MAVKKLLNVKNERPMDMSVLTFDVVKIITRVRGKTKTERGQQICQGNLA